ncbi:hypothetical protein I3842_08G124300 [Carya illinoinensis]|uniref:Uncharacterized protein n=1 Tax=Carya illinoinensis TaxID=32201 RepID=A0A922EBT9_CARIL|nr:hypothetical protein I3842_08G124300 [Carya illinoinensis]
MKSSTSIFCKNWSAEFHFRRGHEFSMNMEEEVAYGTSLGR